MRMKVVSKGQALFGRYAYPPNELGYCGPTDAGGTSELASHAEEFDGAWPYLEAIADAVGASDPLDEDVVGSYWVGGPSLHRVEPADLLARLRAMFKGQATGLLDTMPATAEVLAHHSFHVFVVYPWVRFLHRDAATALKVMQDCRIRSGKVETVAGDHVVMSARPLQFEDGRLTLGEPRSERVRWKKGELSLAPAPEPGSIVSAHWDWVCGPLSDDENVALNSATGATLDLVNATFGEDVSVTGRSEHTGVLRGDRE
jgi:Family of unknown function (DUF6390)